MRRERSKYRNVINVLGQLPTTFPACMSCLCYNLAFESEEHASENRQYDTQDLQETKCLVEYEVVKGGYDDQGAVNN